MFYSSLTAFIIHPFYISFLFLHKTLMARNGLLCAEVPLRNYSISQSEVQALEPMALASNVQALEPMALASNVQA